ncbi:hypothetical protein NIES208_01415 [[Limnothrix rosea] IAM M-220]|nr:hypothetical protein NIES208_01415 [[Limnothrix rosea] IAM M-220]
MGFPVAGSEEDNATVTKLQIGDKTYFGVNSSRNPNRRKITLRVNFISRTHAEADVFQQAFDAGVRSDYVKLVVDRDPCRACGLRGGIKGMARQLGVKTLEIISPSGRQIIQIT